MDSLAAFQEPYARSKDEVLDWDKTKDGIGLSEVVKKVKPTILIGCSTVAGAFNEQVIRDMAKGVDRPIIFPLSNPTRLAEATPADILKWTDDKALVATGSPFPPVIHPDGKARVIAQSNNALAFPGIGLGIISSGAKKLTDEMLWQATIAISECAPVHENACSPVLPTLGKAYEVSQKVAFRLAKQAIKDGVADQCSDKQLKLKIKEHQWEPRYYEYRYVTE